MGGARLSGRNFARIIDIVVISFRKERNAVQVAETVLKKMFMRHSTAM